MDELYRNIRKRRLELKMSQDELARKVGYTNRSTIARIEQGNINLPQSKIAEFARALRVTPSYLVGWEGDITVDNEGMLLAELTAAQEDFMEHYFEMEPKKQTLFEQLAKYSEMMDIPRLELLIRLARDLAIDEEE